MITRQSILRTYAVKAAYRLVDYLDNNNAIDHGSNGERHFIAEVAAFLAGRGENGATLFDVGAHVGGYTATLVDACRNAGMHPEIHVFEPVASSFARLRETFGGAPGITLNNQAVSDSEGTAPIFSDGDRSRVASLHRRNLAAYSRTLSPSETVDLVRLDRYIESRGIRHIHFMKIDVEGHEMSALRGMGTYLDGNFVDFIQFEYGGANLDSRTSLRDFYELFEQAGFTLGKVMPTGIALRGYSPWMDNFRHSNYAALSRRVLPCFS